MSSSGSARRPRVFVSYSHDSLASMDRVLALCDRLRRDGVDADLDRYVGSPPEGWPRWAVRQIEIADFVIVACTEIYRRRFEGIEDTRCGLGVTWEGAILTQALYDAAAVSPKLVPVVFAPEDQAHIPTVLRGMTRYDLSDEQGYERLYRHLTGQPALPRPDLGAVLSLPPQFRVSGFPAHPRAAAQRKRWLWLVAAGALAAVLVGNMTLNPALKREPARIYAATPTPPVLQILRGEILDAGTRLPLPGVLVSLPELGLHGTTDALGQYHFEVVLPAGAQVKLRAIREGYEPINADPPVGSGHLDTHRMWRRP